MKTYRINELLLNRWLQLSMDPDVIEEINKVLCGAPEREPTSPTELSRDTVVQAKRDAMRLLKQIKNNEPLDLELTKLVIRGYIGALDLILALTG